jgi:hypothetical protein
MMRSAILQAALLAAIAGGAGAAEITPGEFESLRKELHVKSQPWASANWMVSVTEAREAAFKAKKPIFLVVNTGNCLGFV